MAWSSWINVADTSAVTAGAGDVLSGKVIVDKNGNAVTGTMANKASTTVEASSVTSDSSYTYLTIPASGYYDTNSKIKTAKSNVGGLKKICTITGNSSYTVSNSVGGTNLLRDGLTASDFTFVVTKVAVVPSMAEYGSATSDMNITNFVPKLSYNDNTKTITMSKCKCTINLADRNDLSGEWEWYDVRSQVTLTVDVYLKN